MESSCISLTMILPNGKETFGPSGCTRETVVPGLILLCGFVLAYLRLKEILPISAEPPWLLKVSKIRYAQDAAVAILGITAVYSAASAPSGESGMVRPFRVFPIPRRHVCECMHACVLMYSCVFIRIPWSIHSMLSQVSTLADAAATKHDCMIGAVSFSCKYLVRFLRIPPISELRRCAFSVYMYMSFEQKPQNSEGLLCATCPGADSPMFVRMWVTRGENACRVLRGRMHLVESCLAMFFFRAQP